MKKLAIIIAMLFLIPSLGFSAALDSKAVTVGGGYPTFYIYDEDAMGSNSAVGLATQQSIKAYVDNGLAGSLEFTNILVSGGNITGITDLVVADGGTGASTFTDGGILMGSGTGAITAAAVLGDGEILIGDGTTDPVALDIGTSTGITTLGTISTGVWSATDIAVAAGGTGVSTLTDGGVLLGSGTGAITATAVLGDGEILIGDGTTDPVALDVGSSTAITILGTVATGVWEATDIGVQHGGTGASTLTDHGILLGSGTSAVTALGSATNGQIPVGSTGADPVLATITGTTGEIAVTNGAGTITLDFPDDIIVGTGKTFSFEGTADDFETTLAAEDPTTDNTITLPDYDGGVPIVIAQSSTQTSVSNTTADVTGSSLTIADGWFTAGKTLKWTIYGTCSGANDAKHAILYIDNAAIVDLTLDAADVGDFVAEFIMHEHTDTANQDAMGQLQMAAEAAYVDYATDTTDFNDGGTTTVKLQLTSGNAGDTITADYVLIEHWVK